MPLNILVKGATDYENDKSFELFHAFKYDSGQLSGNVECKNMAWYS